MATWRKPQLAPELLALPEMVRQAAETYRKGAEEVVKATVEALSPKPQGENHEQQ